MTHLPVWNVWRLRRRKLGLSRDPDRRPQHDPNQARQATYYGYTVGKWEGDTLVLESISFVDSTWLGRGGLFHSGDMPITEKLTRQGNEILYEGIVQDPESFLEPWVMTPRTLRLNTNNDGIHTRARKLRSLRNREHHHTASALARGESPGTEGCRSGAVGVPHPRQAVSARSAHPWLDAIPTGHQNLATLEAAA